MTQDVTQIETTDGILAGQRLQPCPFCGEAKRFSAMIGWMGCIDEDTGKESDGSSISCDACSTYGPVAFGGLFGAMKLWNARPGK